MNKEKVFSYYVLEDIDKYLELYLQKVPDIFDGELFNEDDEQKIKNIKSLFTDKEKGELVYQAHLVSNGDKLVQEVSFTNANLNKNKDICSLFINIVKNAYKYNKKELQKQYEEKERQELNKLTEKELLVNILLALKQLVK